jgi:hypothetical protein
MLNLSNIHLLRAYICPSGRAAERKYGWQMGFSWQARPPFDRAASRF